MSQHTSGVPLKATPFNDPNYAKPLIFLPGQSLPGAGGWGAQQGRVIVYIGDMSLSKQLRATPAVGGKLRRDRVGRMVESSTVALSDGEYASMLIEARFRETGRWPASIVKGKRMDLNLLVENVAPAGESKRKPVAYLLSVGDESFDSIGDLLADDGARKVLQARKVRFSQDGPVSWAQVSDHDSAKTLPNARVARRIVREAELDYGLRVAAIASDDGKFIDIKFRREYTADELAKRAAKRAESVAKQAAKRAAEAV